MENRSEAGRAPRVSAAPVGDYMEVQQEQVQQRQVLFEEYWKEIVEY